MLNETSCLHSALLYSAKSDLKQSFTTTAVINNLSSKPQVRVLRRFVPKTKFILYHLVNPKSDANRR